MTLLTATLSLAAGAVRAADVAADARSVPTAPAPVIRRYRVGPVETESDQAGHESALISRSITFRQAGWLRGWTVTAVPADGLAPPPEGAPLRFATLSKVLPRNERSRVLVAGRDRFSVRLPEGAGIPVEPGALHVARVHLGASAAPRSFFVDFEIEVLPRGPGAALRDLVALPLRGEAASSAPAGGRLAGGWVALGPSCRGARLEGPDGRELAAQAPAAGHFEAPAAALPAGEFRLSGCGGEDGWMEGVLWLEGAP